MERIKRLREAKKWSQAQMAYFLGCDQATVSRLEAGQKETGPIAKLLDALESGEIKPKNETQEAAS